MKKLIFYISFFVFLVLIFWLAIGWNTDYFKKSQLLVRGRVQPFELINQDSSSFSNLDMKGKVCVVEYFFTTCLGICPKMNKNMKLVYDEFKDQDNFLIVSHTCQPEIDSLPLLQAYAKKMGVNTNKWKFVTGRKDSLYNLARFSYGIDDPKNAVNKIEDDFIHSQFFALVDKTGMIRSGVYDGLMPADIEKLKKDIRALLKEKPLGNQFSNGFNK